jgi:hypothetical protein
MREKNSFTLIAWTTANIRESYWSVRLWFAAIDQSFLPTPRGPGNSKITLSSGACTWAILMCVSWGRRVSFFGKVVSSHAHAPSDVWRNYLYMTRGHPYHDPSVAAAIMKFDQIFRSWSAHILSLTHSPSHLSMSLHLLSCMSFWSWPF